MDEVTLVLRLIKDNWTNSATALVNAGHITNSHIAPPKYIDIRSIEPQEGRRVDIDSESVIVFFEDSSSTTYPTIDYAARTEEFSFTLHLRTIHDKLEAMYKIVRHVLENNSFRPAVYATPADSSSATLGDADLIRLTSRSEANDRGKRLLGYKIGVELKRFARCTL